MKMFKLMCFAMVASATTLLAANNQSSSDQQQQKGTGNRGVEQDADMQQDNPNQNMGKGSGHSDDNNMRNNQRYGTSERNSNNGYWAHGGRYGYPGGCGSCGRGCGCGNGSCNNDSYCGCGNGCGCDNGYGYGQGYYGYGYNRGYGRNNNYYGQRNQQFRYRDNSLAAVQERLNRAEQQAQAEGNQNQNQSQYQAQNQNQFQNRGNPIAMNDDNAVQAKGDTDDAVANKVRNALKNDSTLSPRVRAIDVVVRNGKVVLVGVVTSEGEKRKIEIITRKVDGVKDVENNLKADQK